MGYSDGVWAGDLDDCKTTSEYRSKLSRTAVSWRSKKRTCVALTTAEVEYMALASVSQEVVWMKRIQYNLNEARVAQQSCMMTTNLRFEWRKIHGRAKQ